MSMLLINNSVFKVFTTADDIYLDGEDFNNCVIDYLVEQYKKKKISIDITSNLALGVPFFVYLVWMFL